MLQINTKLLLVIECSAKHTMYADDIRGCTPNWNTLSARQAAAFCGEWSGPPPVSEACRLLRGVGWLLACKPGVEPRRSEPTVCWECVDELDDVVRWRDNDCEGGGPVVPRLWVQQPR